MFSLGDVSRLAALASPNTALKSHTRPPFLSAPESVILSELPGPKISVGVDKKKFYEILPLPEFWNDSAA